MSHNEKNTSQEEQAFLEAEKQGFESDHPFTGILSVFVVFVAVFVVVSSVGAWQLLRYELSTDVIWKDKQKGYTQAAAVEGRVKDAALVEKGGRVDAPLAFGSPDDAGKIATFQVDPIQQGIAALIANPQYIEKAPLPTLPAQKSAPTPAPAPTPVPPIRPTPTPAPAPLKRKAPKKVEALDPASVARGQALYKNNACWTCHGNDGDGKGPAGVALPIKPTAFVTGVYKYGSGMGDIFKIITNGSPNKASGMVGYAHLPENDRWDLAKYLLSLKK